MTNSAPRTVLLAVSGMSPAILTETVWALARSKPAVIPDEVIVLTTTAGARDLQSQLLAARSDWDGLSVWTALRRALLGARAETSHKLQLAAPRIIERPDPVAGVKQPADDLRTPADNAAAADFLLEEVRRLTENPDVRVIASIAGGRKTMGALLYGAMSLLGRETDRLTHVLVSDPFDRCRDFFFPGQPVDPSVPGRSGDFLRATAARIDLADIPFVPLRNLFERDLARRPGSFAALVAEASRRLPAGDIPRMRVRRDSPSAEISGVTIRFSPREQVLLLLLASQCAEGRPHFPDHPHAHTAFLALTEELLAEADADNFADWRGSADRNVEPDDLRKIVNGLRTKLRKAGPDGIALAATLESRRGLGFAAPPETFQVG